MNNEPVAWMYAVNGIWTAFSDELPPDDAYDEGTLTPLYTHPANLTDEEILQANLEFGKENGEDYSMLTIEDIEPLIGLVKFVLRKAQEK